LLDDEIVKLSDIVCFISFEDGVFLETESSFELFDKAKGSFCIGDIVWQGFLNQADTFFSNKGMCSVSPEEERVFFLAVDELAGVIAQSCLWITFWFLFLAGAL